MMNKVTILITNYQLNMKNGMNMIPKAIRFIPSTQMAMRHGMNMMQMAT